MSLKKMAWGVTYFDQIILSMSSLKMTYLNIRAAAMSCQGYSENANKECSKACQHIRRIYKSI